MAARSTVTRAQREVLLGCLFGPLFRRRSNWCRPQTRPAAAKMVDILVERGLLERATTRAGVPMVRITDAGRTTIGADVRPGGARRRADLEAEAVPSLADRIAP